MKSVIAALCLMPVVGFAQAGGPGAAAAAAAAASSPATSPYPSRTPMWRCDLPGGTYEVAIRNIISVSTHDYVVDGVARVTEVNIETAGTTEVRFYYLEPITPSSPIGAGQSAIDKVQELATEAASHLNPGEEPPWEKVVKSYPATTHAHTVEYRLDTKEDLESLFNSAEQAFRLNQNTELTLEGGPASASGSGGGDN
jgi:hypothetical protein